MKTLHSIPKEYKELKLPRQPVFWMDAESECHYSECSIFSLTNSTAIHSTGCVRYYFSQVLQVWPYLPAIRTCNCRVCGLHVYARTNRWYCAICARNPYGEDHYPNRTNIWLPRMLVNDVSTA